MRKIIFFLAFLLSSQGHAQSIFDPSKITTIKINFEKANWSFLLDSLKTRGMKERMVANVEIDGKLYKGVGVRYKGNSSYKNPKKRNKAKLPFNLKANYVDKDQRFLGGYETLKLGNVFMDPSFVREYVSYEIARKYMPAPRCNFAKVYINNQFIGLYSNVQSVDAKLLEDSYGTTNDTFFKCDPEWEDVVPAPAGCKEGEYSSLTYVGDNPDCYNGWYELESRNGNGWKDLIEMSKMLNQNPATIDQKINVDMTLWMHAFNHVLVNLDSYTGRFSHNYYLYKTPDGLLTPLIWDLNISFGGFRLDGEKQGELTNQELQEFSLFTHFKNKNPKRPLITNLLTNPFWRKIYIGHCRTILLENFANGEYLKLAENMQATIRDAVKEDPNRLYSFEDFEKNLRQTTDIGNTKIIGIEELMKSRTETLLKHPLFNGKIPVVSDPKHTIAGNKVKVEAKVTDAQKVYLMYRPNAKSPFKQIEMVVSTDGNHSASLDKQEIGHYYLIAEGERLAICSPERASYVFYEVK